MSRVAERDAFLAQAGWAGASVRPLAGDASNRRYDRLTGGPEGWGAVLMDAPTEKGEDVGPFLGVTEALRARGFSAPEVLAADPERGFLLLEDLGDALFARVCAAEPARERELYLTAAELLAELHAAPVAYDADPYDEAALLREAMLLPEWYMWGLGKSSPDLAEEFAGLVAEAAAPVAGARSALALRDYHAENLVWLPAREGIRRVGLLDYQDALLGHPSYDLVSLTEDARRDTSPELRTAAEARYLEASGAEPEGFREAAAILAAQRNLKIVGIFARLRLRDEKAQYLAMIPRVWSHLMRDLSHPSLAPLKAWVEARVPAPTPQALARLKEGRT